ncbi:tetratricopeptide repeat protein [Halomonas sp. I1]|uniref:tetratricopeptide repeat protein n=1 Tax=Halomonas sp. I1 TaxID=393536 RepID=UPI0028DE3400|nr:tetratricopeptide repeat protein [Halomonas sp. I1]MDT8893323.1 tetratricopeptide repeat protein [Halomonas sp. I1]
MCFVRLLFAIALLSLPCSVLALDDEARSAKEEGMRLWGISEWIKMQPYLEKSAESGDVESMYYLGEANRLLDRGLSHDAMDWYLKAADHGDPYAMLRLHSGGACVAGDYCPEEAEGWREKARAITLPKAEAGDTDAMVALYYIYAALDDEDEGIDWLERAAEAGNPEAQYRMGSMIHGGYGWYFLESRRLKAAERWLRKAAEQGYVPAMDALAEVLGKENRPEAAWRWKVKSSNNGYLEERLTMGGCYLDPERWNEKIREGLCQNKKNVVKGWGISYAVFKETGNDTAEWIMDKSRGDMTPEKIQEAEELAQEWLNKEPPLSKFPPRYGF